MAPQRAIPAATMIRAAHAVVHPAPAQAPARVPAQAPARVPTPSMLDIDVLVGNIVRIMESATARAAGAAADAAGTVMVKAMEVAFARVTDTLSKQAVGATPEAAFVKSLETAFVEALKATAPITGQAIEAAAAKA